MHGQAEAAGQAAEGITRLSAIIAAYNQRERLLQAIESVQRQSSPPHEVIVVDDGSSDGTPEAVKHRYPNVRVEVQTNLGKSVARNHGASLATGDWLCFLDHDDLWHPDKLLSVEAYVRQHPEVIAIDHGVWIFRESKEGRETAWSLRTDFVGKTLDDALQCIEELGSPKNDFGYLQRTGNAYEASLRRVFSTTSALCIRRDAFFKAGGFHPAHANGEDWSLSINIARLGEWHTLPSALSCQRVLPTADTSDPAGMVMILSTLVNHWYSGRPLRDRTRGFEFVPELRKYADENRRLAQLAIWSSLRPGRSGGAGPALWLSMLLLPRWRDRLYAALPPPVTWRVGRCLSRMRS
jgi:glycosyltransferase involved in cell wall biosynthesis